MPETVFVLIGLVILVVLATSYLVWFGKYNARRWRGRTGNDATDRDGSRPKK